jgi:choline dehydrogenase-like flavoprotein
MAERVDVCIVGSGFGGSIAAWRLAELYRAAETKPSIVVLERGKRFGHKDFKQSMDVGHLSDVYGLIQGQGAQIIVANLVGGGSNLYLAASLRSPRETFERQDHHPNDGPRRRMWPRGISRKTLDPYYARAEAALRVRQPSWKEVSKSGGVWAAMLRESGFSCDRVPLAIDFDRCVDAKWCYTGCVFGAKNSVITNYQASSERAGVEYRPLVRVDSVAPSSARPYRWRVQGVNVDPATKGSAGAIEEIECKVLILAAGAMGSPPILIRSRVLGALPNVSRHLGRHLGVNGDHVAAIELNPKAVRDVLGLPGYKDFYKGKPITTMTYDHWVGKRGNEHDGTRFNLQEILLSQLTNFLYDDGRGADAAEPSWWGRGKKRAISAWDRRIEILAMVEDTHDGEFLPIPSPGGDGNVQPNGGPVGVGLFSYLLSPQSTRIREQADDAIRRICERRGIGKFMKLAETEGAYASHPLGGCRMADSAAFGVTDHSCEVFGNEGLFCMDSSAIPTSLGVNPSLTISAVCERAAAQLVSRADDFGLPKPPAGFKHRVPREIVGPRVHP